jgi:integrase
MPLTAIQCSNAKPKDKPYRLADSGGMYMEVMPNGSKYWRLKYRLLGKEKRLALGVYPAVSLAEAREGRDIAKKMIKAGEDPCFVKKEGRRQKVLNAEHTFKAVASEWHKAHLIRWSENYGKEIIHRLEQDVFPHIGNRPIADISPMELLDVIKKIEKRGALEAARRTLQLCGQVFKYAIPHGLAERNPAPDIAGALAPYKRKHFAALEASDIPEFLQVLERNEARLFPQTRHAMHLLMLTFVRTSELIEATWDEFDLEAKEWAIPAERMKMRKPHLVPLSDQAIAILKAQKELTGQWKWLFPNRVRPIEPMSNNTILVALKRMGYKSRMTGHGFRALAMSTIKEKLGWRHEVVDRQLAHAHRNSVIAAYDRAEFWDDRKKMMQQWADYLDALANEGKVVVADFKRKTA